MYENDYNAILDVLREAVNLKYNRFFLPDDKAFPSNAVFCKRVAYDRLLIILEGNKDEHMSINGEFRLVQLKPGDVMFYHKEAWEEQNFSRKHRLLCIIPTEKLLRLVCYNCVSEPRGKVPGNSKIVLTKAVPLPVFFDTMRAIGAYGTVNHDHIFHLVRALISLAIQECERDSNVSIERARQNYSRIHTFLEENYMQNLDRKTIASHFNLTETYISSLFSQYGKKSLMHHLMDIRLDAAIGLLNSCDWSIKEIAFSCGFASDIYFIRCFRKKYNTTPGEYRVRFRR